MTGPRLAERRWTSEDEKLLKEMRAAGETAVEIARKLKRSPGAIYARINVSKRIPAGGRRTRSLPSERLVWAIEFPDNPGQQET
jgi:hypothetical protein